MTDMTWQQRQINDFHKRMPLETGDYANPSGIEGATLALRAKLIDEESSEMIVAHSAGDVVGFFGELCDVAVVVLGSYDVAGRVARDRFVLLLETQHKRGWQGLTKNLAGEVTLLMSLCNHTVADMQTTYTQGATWTRFHMLDAILIQWAHTCCATGVDVRPLFDAVMASNMTKAPAVLREDGKLMKGPNYVKHNLAPLLIEQGVEIP